jgi:hypothetical protein
MPTADPAAIQPASLSIAPEAPSEEEQLDSGVAPLLFVFMLPMLVIVGLVLWIGASPTWLLVGVTIATIGLMTGIVMLAINRLLADGAADH